MDFERFKLTEFDNEPKIIDHCMSAMPLSLKDICRSLNYYYHKSLTLEEEIKTLKQENQKIKNNDIQITVEGFNYDH